MNRSHTKYLLIGGGLAAASAAAAIRAADQLGSLLLIARENTQPYRRKNLPTLLSQAHPNRQSLYVHPAGWYDQHHVHLRTGRQVEAIDPSRHCVILDNAEQVSYEQLLIATGASPNRVNAPGADLPNVMLFRTYEDADRLHNSLLQVRAEGRLHPLGRGRVTILGAGIMGMELAGELASMQIQVDLIDSGSHPWPQLAGQGIGRFALRHLLDKGVYFHGQTQVSRLEGDGRVQHVVLDSPSPGDPSKPLRLETDLVIVALGVSPAKEMVRHTALAAERAILVDEQCRTSLPNIFAAGDCAAVYDPLFGKHRLTEAWDTAEETGQIAGANMAGGDARWAKVSHFQMIALGLTLEAWGDHRQVSHRLYRAPTNSQGFKQIEFGIAADGRLAQVLTVGQWPDEERVALESMIHQRLATQGIEEQLKDPAMDVSSLLP